MIKYSMPPNKTKYGTSVQHLRSWIDHNSGPPGHKLAPLETLQKRRSKRLFTVDMTKALAGEPHGAEAPRVGRASITPCERPWGSSSAARNRAANLKANLELMDKIPRKKKEGDDGTTTRGRSLWFISLLFRSISTGRPADRGVRIISPYYGSIHSLSLHLRGRLGTRQPHILLCHAYLCILKERCGSESIYIYIHIYVYVYVCVDYESKQ
jgi:hypothetical protein